MCTDMKRRLGRGQIGRILKEFRNELENSRAFVGLFRCNGTNTAAVLDG